MFVGLVLCEGERIVMLGLNEAIDQLAMTNSVCWFGLV